MLITEIRLLKNGLFGLFSGENFLFSLDGDMLSESGLHTGDAPDDAELESLRSRAQERKAVNKALVLLSYRDYSLKELSQKLLRDFPQDAAQAAAERMEELGLINDEKYAGKLAQHLIGEKGWGSRRVAYEMARRGIGREIIDQTLSENDDDPAERALKYLKKKYPRGITDDAARRRASAALARNGYVWDEIRRAIMLYEETEGQDAD